VGRVETATMRTDPVAKAWQVAGMLGRLLVGGLFVYAAQSKIIDPLKFAEEVRAYELAPLITTNAIAIVLPWLELITAVLLIVGLWRGEARLLVLLMMVGFTFGKISVLLRGLDINCGCFGNEWLESTFHGIWGVLLNVVIIGLLLLDYYAQRLRRATPQAAPVIVDEA